MIRYIDELDSGNILMQVRRPSVWLTVLSSVTCVCFCSREDLDNKQIPHHHKLLEGIINQFKQEFAKLKVELSVRLLSFFQNVGWLYQQSAGKISLMTDIWSNQKLLAFLAVTVHWLSINNGKLSLHAALIGFHHMTGKHSGKAIADALVLILERVSILTKVCGK